MPMSGRRCETDEVLAMCCFCGASVDDDGALSLVVTEREGDESQGLTCHAPCLSQRLHDSVPRLFA